MALQIDEGKKTALSGALPHQEVGDWGDRIGRLLSKIRKGVQVGGFATGLLAIGIFLIRRAVNQNALVAAVNQNALVAAIILTFLFAVFGLIFANLVKLRGNTRTGWLCVAVPAYLLILLKFLVPVYKALSVVERTTLLLAIILHVVAASLGPRLFRWIKRRRPTRRLLVGAPVIVAFGIAYFFLVLSPLYKELTTKAGSRYSAAEQKIVDLGAGVMPLKVQYERIQQSHNEDPALSKGAQELAHKMSDIKDLDLRISIQIFKYESIAYLWAMVAGSESDKGIRRQSVNAALEASKTAKELIDDVMKPGVYKKQTQDVRNWLVQDDAQSRVQRLEAVALCIQWKDYRRQEDHDAVRRIIQNFPKEYSDREHPEQSDELKQCWP
jgi:hypothetical protein